MFYREVLGMGLFSKKDKEMEEVINQIRVNLSNNYKDNAIDGIEKMKFLLTERQMSGKLKGKQLEEYNKLLADFQHDVANFKRTY